MRILKQTISITNNEIYNVHFLVTFTTLMIGLLNDATDLRTSFLGRYCLASVFLQSVPYICYFLYMLFLNIKVYVFFCKHRKEVDNLFYSRQFTKRQWATFLQKGNFSYYQSMFILNMFIERGVFFRQGKHYRYNDETLDF